jgi:MFS family permease
VVMQGGRYRWFVLGAVLVSVLSFGTTNTLLGAALGTVADDLGTTTGSLGWTLTGPFLAMGIGSPIFGRLGDVRGHRPVFLGGGVLFALSTLATFAVHDAGLLIALRFVAGIGAAAASPTGMALIFAEFAGNDRPRAMGWFHLVNTGAPAIGLATGGPLIEWLGWRTVFVAYGVLGALGVGVAALVLRPGGLRATGSVDIRGGLVLATGSFGAMLGLSLGGSRGWTDAATLAVLALAPAAAFVFVLVERRVTDPLVPLEFFRMANVSGPLVAFFLLNMAYMGGLVMTPLLLQDVFGLSLGTLTFLLVVRPGTFSLASPIGGAMTARLGERWAGSVGASAMLLSMIAFLLGARLEAIALVVVALALSGATFGISAPAASTAVSNSVPQDSLGVATGILHTAGAVGTGAGIQVAFALLGDSDPHVPADFTAPLVVLIAASAAGAAAMSVVRPTVGRHAVRAAPVPSTEGDPALDAAPA